METKYCVLCNKEKSLKEFNKNSRYKDGYYKHCKECHYEVYGRPRHILATYGLTQEDYNTLLKKQEYKCFSCGKAHGTFKTDRLFIDHCHDTGKVRGLLCHDCNVALGAATDNIETLRNLIKFLENHNESRN